MNRIGIKIDLDTGDLVSSAGRARQSIAGLTDEMKKAQKEGRWEDFAKISFERDRLQGKTSGFEKDIRTLANDPRLQTQTSTGGTVLKIDSEYANAIKNQTDAIKKLTDEYQGAIRSGNVGKIHELTPQIEKQQSELHKTVKDIINTNGEFPQRPSLDNNTPDGGQKNQRSPTLPGSDDWRELKGLSGAITQEHDVGNWGQVSRLGNNKDALRGIMGEYDRDSKLEAKIKADPEFASQLKEIRDALKGTIAAIDEAAANGEYEKVDQLTGQAKQLQGISHKIIGENSPSMDAQGGAKAAQAFAQTFGTDRIVSAITSGVSSAVSYANKAGIVNRMGGGDAIGAQIEETRKEGDLVGGIGKTMLTAIGGIVGNIVAPGIGGVAAGALIGGGIGDLVKSLGFDLGANVRETDEARAQQWQQQAQDPMQLGAILGVYGGSMEENTRNLRTAFDRAAQAANEFGFSTQEGIETIKQAAEQGLSYDESLAAARNIYSFERGTGADRGTLTSFETQMSRYGEKDALGVAWQGNQASGLETGQYSEFLRAMQRIFEDGISKGFVRGAKEISETLTFLSDLNNGSELWKGEQGANRLSQINSSVEQTTNLASTTDILSYRGAQNVLRGYTTDDWKKLLDIDNDGSEDAIRGRGGSEYVNAMMVLERGLTPKLFNEQMKMFNMAEKGDYASVIERMRQAYGLDYTQSAQLYKSWEQNKNTPGYFDSEAFALELEKYTSKPPENNSAELAMFRDVETIRTKVAEIGMHYADKRAPETHIIVMEVTREANQTPTGIIPPPGPNETGGADGTGNTGGPYFPPEMPQRTIKDIMGGIEDMPVFNDMAVPGPSFNNRLEASKNADPNSAEHQAYLGLQKHFSGLMDGDIQRARQLNFYPSIWRDSAGDITKFWDTIQRSGGVPDVNREDALSGFFDKRGDKGVLKGLGTFLHLGNNDSTSRDRLNKLELNAQVGTNDYNLLMRSYAQLAAFNPQQRETVDRENTLNTILQDNQLTAQKLYDAVVELARQMGVRIVYE
jgi:hypothetical protein